LGELPQDPSRLRLGSSLVSCSDSSRQLGEELAGTAPVALAWALLLEHPPPYEHEPIESLAPDLLVRVNDLLRHSGKARLQLMHRPGDIGRPPQVFVASTDPDAPRLVSVAYAELVEGDAQDLRELFARGEPVEEPLYLVCAHGRRDACCAKRGVAFERALRARVPGRVYQTSHVGGHRFAATAVVYPEAFYYGRLEPSDAASLANAHEVGAIGPTQKLRGRASRAADAQAAEVFALRRMGALSPTPTRLARLPDGVFEIEIADSRTQLSVERRPLAQDSQKGCGEEPARLDAFVEL